MTKALEVEIATFLYRVDFAKSFRSTVPLISSLLLSALLSSVPLAWSGQGVAKAQSYQSKPHRSPRKVAYNRQVRRIGARGRSRRYRMVRTTEKSFFSGLFGGGQKKRRRPTQKSLFGSFKLLDFLKQGPSSSRSGGGGEEGRAPRIVTYGDGARGWSLDRPARRGSYRTMCVRLCDGYYYPVSFKTGPGQFANDEALCNSGCSKAPTKLFYYSNPGGSLEDMRALDGQRYKDLANAFRYRKEYVADCRCKAEPWSRQARARHENWAKSQKQARLISKREWTR